ncbi:helix-turn-helix domain-containing protein [Hyphobacterium sp. HN65]|uniref:Helix-turn-helix domain-containing protein n=1 Tax=Hyphobacterium lacteum TaxID=3116575 RepID=A0ABU7LSL8_9PROT|nr:helix-turn-helix domain-containing protein [Hyphobacterium sp. HN65]MEE2526860.1 helix-turn-helix domain-containing protein [Hyphobacterium sp. HN65]
MNSDLEIKSPARPKQRRSAKTLEKMIAAVEQLLQERDFREVTMADIAKSAGVTAALLYTRFRNKDELEVYVTSLFLERYIHDLKTAREGLEGPCAREPESLIRTFGEVTFAYRAVIRSILTRQLSGQPFTPKEDALITERAIFLEDWMSECSDQGLTTEQIKIRVLTLIQTIQAYAMHTRVEGYLPYDQFCSLLGSSFGVSSQ